jgi:6-phosphofructokinase 1
VIPERETTPEAIAQALDDAYRRGKQHALVVVAEGAKWNARALIAYFDESSVEFEIRATILGHVQRGGKPTAFDRLLGTRLGARAVRLMVEGESGILVGLHGAKVGPTPLGEIAGKTKELDLELLDLASVLT